MRKTFMERRTFLFCLLTAVSFFCINMGKQFSESLGEFELKSGAEIFVGDFTEGGEPGGKIRKICFKDNSYANLGAHEGDTYLKVYKENSDVEEKIDLKIISKIETIKKYGGQFCARKGGENCFWIRLTLENSTSEAKDYQMRVGTKVNFEFVHHKRKGSALLHKIDKIENIRREGAVAVPGAGEAESIPAAGAGAAPEAAAPEVAPIIPGT